MKCLRCGSCCLWDVFIPVQVGDIWWIAHKPHNVRCPHYARGETQAECKIHNEEIFHGSPCDRYGNPDYDPDFLGKEVCRIGQAISNAHRTVDESIDTEGVRLLEPFAEW